ncbi:FAD-binding oxidoreductase [Rhizobium puerariae]|uniref:FAD-binding oxidoreductase n=1 Tax=Rhizobium puerariae TaxID=1585791 RepID=A0ABV6AH34_9HYPH
MTSVAFIERLPAGGHDLGIETDRDMMARHLADATRKPGPVPSLVARPKTTEGVSAFLKACHDAGQPVAVQGGLTGLSGGARPLEGEVVLSLERMRSLGPVDAVSATIVVEAGARLQTVQEAAESAGLCFGVDIGARGSATIGGMIATNAGGIRVLRHDMMRAQILGLEAVLADGTVLSSLRGLMKDNSGPNLNQLFIGGEGLFGVVTRACLRLSAKPAAERNALCAVPSVDSALVLLQRLRSALGPQLTAFEGIFAPVYEGISAMRRGAIPLPAGSPLYVIAEMQIFGAQAGDDVFETVLIQAYEDGLCSDIVVSRSGREFAAIWDVREGCTEFTFSLGRLTGHDISVPLRSIPAFMAEAETLLAGLDPEAGAYVFGHLGDGNLHYVVRTGRREAVSPEIYRLAARLGGSVTAEHGVGLDKKDYLSLVRSPAELATIRMLKAALDPKAILNRGRVL